MAMSKRAGYKPLKGGTPRGSSSGVSSCGIDRLIKLGSALVIIFPWVALVLMLGYGSLLRGRTDVIKELPGGKKCIGWRQTYYCHPFA